MFSDEHHTARASKMTNLSGSRSQTSASNRVDRVPHYVLLKKLVQTRDNVSDDLQSQIDLLQERYDYSMGPIYLICALCYTILHLVVWYFSCLLVMALTWLGLHCTVYAVKFVVLWMFSAGRAVVTIWLHLASCEVACSLLYNQWNLPGRNYC